MAPQQADFQAASSKLVNLFLTTRIDDLPVSDYTRRYYSDYLPKIHYAVETASKTILAGLNSLTVPIREAVIVESGGGIGLLTFLSALAGAKQVIYNDLFEGSCNDFKVIAKAFGIDGISVVHGSSDAIRSFCVKESIRPHLVVSRNVIEHVYDIPEYLRELHQLNDDIVLSFSTTANYSNPMVRHYTKRIHKRVENIGTGDSYGKKSSDAVEPYFKIRFDYIIKEFPGLPKTDAGKLAACTRGMMFSEIKVAVEKFLEHGALPVPASGTNTCDPNTGNWAENLLPKNELAGVFKKGGFELDIICGHWNTRYKKAYLKAAAFFFNLVMKALPFTRLRLSPYVILVGRSA